MVSSMKQPEAEFMAKAASWASYIGLHNLKTIYNGHASIKRASMKVDAFYLSTAFYSLSPCPVFSKSYGESLIGNAVGDFSLFGSDRRYLLIRLCGLCI